MQVPNLFQTKVFDGHGVGGVGRVWEFLVDYLSILETLQ
jgi:hypothetical protein